VQYFNRQTVPPPAVFTSPIAGNNRESLRALFDFDSEKLSQSFAPRSFLGLDEQNVRNGLDRLFRGKCAFCEAETSTRPYRFRPASEATPVAPTDMNSHLYYTWLVDAWQNIYPICTSCAPSDREGSTYFPVIGRRCRLPTPDELNQFVDDATGLWPDHPPAEKPLLLDPCDKKDFTSHFRVSPNGMLFGKNKSAEETISYFTLNRDERVNQRAAKFQSLLSTLDDYLAGGDPGLLRSIVAFPDMEFGGTWFLLARQICLTIGYGGGPTPALSMARIDRALRRLQSQPDARQSLSAAVEAISQASELDVDAELAGTTARTGKLRLQRVSLTNFKALENLNVEIPAPAQLGPEAVSVAPSLLILGENAAGKSSILEAIAIALATDDARDELALAPSDYILKPDYMGAPDHVAPDHSKVELLFEDGSNHLLTVDRTGFEINSKIDRSLLPPVFAYGAYRRYLRKQRQYSPAKYITNLMRSDGILSNPEKWLLGLDAATFAMVVRQLRHVLSIEGDFEVIRRNQDEQRCYIVTSIPGSTTQFSLTPLEVASSGFRTVLATVCDIFQGLLDRRVSGGIETLAQARAVVLIDEVESHLHPRWKMGIMRGLRQALPNVTFIATTHDPLCLRGMGDRDVVVLQRVGRDPDADVKVETRLPVFVERLVNLPPTSHLTVEQLLTSDFFQLYSADAPEIEGKFANISDLLAKRSQGAELSDDEKRTLEAFDDDIDNALPVGLSEAHRLVQEAVAQFLKERRSASEDRLRALRQSSKNEILRILKGAAG
jgi:hypothetical protein